MVGPCVLDNVLYGFLEDPVDIDFCKILDAVKQNTSVYNLIFKTAHKALGL